MVRGQQKEYMCGSERYFSAIPCFTYDQPRELLLHLTFLDDLSVVSAGAKGYVRFR